MCIYVRNNPAKFHLDPIWNDWALGFFMLPKQEQQEQPYGTDWFICKLYY